MNHTGRGRGKYYIRKRLVPIQESILVHLLDFYMIQWPRNLPYGISQEGISDGVVGHRGHVSRSLRDLIEEGYVYQEVGRVDGLKTRVKVYHLTEKGATRARRIREELRSVAITLRRRNGTEEELTLDKIHSQYVGKCRLLDIALCSERGVLDEAEFEKWLKSKERFVEVTRSMPKIRHFYGRKEELRAIGEWTDSEESRVLVIHGIPGIGKTTLASKAVEVWRDQANILWYRIHPWTTLVDVLRAIAELLSEMNKHTLSSYVRSDRVHSVEESLIIIEKGFLGTKSILVLDDVHQSSDQVRDLLRGLIELCEKIEGIHLVLVGRHVPALYDIKDVKVKGLIRELPLKGLNQEDAFQLLEERGFDGETAESAYEVTKGHPLFLELVEQPDLTKSRDVERYVDEEFFSTLSEGERKILKIASVYRFPVFIHGFFLEPELTHESVRALVHQSMIVETEDSRYYLHDLVKQFCSKRLTPSEMKRYNAGAAEYYVSMGDPRSLLEAIHHAIIAGEVELAVGLATSNGKDIIKRGLSDEFAELIDVMLEKEMMEEDRAELLLQKASILSLKGEWDHALKYYDESLEFSERVGADIKISEALRKKGEILVARSEYSDAQTWFKKALTISRRSKDLLGLAEIYRNLSIIFSYQGQYARARKQLELSQRWAMESGSDAALGRALLSLGSLETRKGNYGNALEYKMRALRIAEREKDVYELINAYNSLGVANAHLDDYSAALEFYKRSADLAQRVGDVRSVAYSFENIAGILVEIGDLDEAERCLDEAIETFIRIGEKRMIASCHVYYGYLFNLRGNRRLSDSHMKRAINLLEELGALHSLAYAYHVRGLIYQSRGMVRESNEYFNRAKSMAAELGNKGLLKQISKDRISYPAIEMSVGQAEESAALSR